MFAMSNPFNGAPDGPCPLTRYSWRDSIRSNLSEPLMKPSLLLCPMRFGSIYGNESRHFGLV
jgi:hypothetical protein